MKDSYEFEVICKNIIIQNWIISEYEEELNYED